MKRKRKEQGAVAAACQLRSGAVHPFTDLRGFVPLGRGEERVYRQLREAIPVLDKYLDDAYIAHLPNVRVVHGRGTGALKAGVHRHLKKLSYVKEFRLGDFGEGDTGVTIVTFK